MKALVLEEKGKLSLRDFPIKETVGADDVRIRIRACGICGSDVHYYKEGAIGDFIVREPMILGHEAAGDVIEVGSNVKNLKVGDRVCMEPGIPNFKSVETLTGHYNLDPDVVFWATPPVHGCLREDVVHPASFTFRLDDRTSYAEGALIEPFAIGMEAAKQAAIQAGDTVLVTGCGTIGLMCALASLCAGAAKVIITDVKQAKLDIAASFSSSIIPVNTKEKSLIEEVRSITAGRGADVIIEASGFPGIYPEFMRAAKNAGMIVLVGMMNGTVPVDVPYLENHGISIRTVFRYCNVYKNAADIVASGTIDFKRVISATFPFEKSIEAYELAASGKEDIVKVMIEL